MSTPSLNDSPARAFATRWFGRTTTLVESRPTVGVAAAVLVPRNPNRLSFTLSNRSSSQLDLGTDATVQPGTGLPLGGNGGTLIMNVDEDGEAVSQAFYGVGPSAGLACYLLEVVAL